MACRGAAVTDCLSWTFVEAIDHEQTGYDFIRTVVAMLPGRFRAVLCASLLMSIGTALGQSYDPAAVRMFHALAAKPNLLARYEYLQKLGPHLPAADQNLAGQMSAFALAELGLYSRAVLTFPLKMRPVPGLVLPDPKEWQAEDALDVIAKAAANRRIVMINEVHHNAQTRALTLLALPRLRALGFTHLAIEALGDDPELVRRGFPLRTSGTEYLQEPLYGEIVREAIRLGFVLVPYDDDRAGADVEAREAGQAQNLYDRVFARDPAARLVVAAGYAHIDKAVGRLGPDRPMAMTLARLTDSEPLSVDQAQFLEVEWGGDDDYHRLVRRFPTEVPEVLVDKASGRPWSAAPKLYDISVISPPSLTLKSLGAEEVADPALGRYRNLSNGVQMAQQAFVAFNDMLRPKWLELGGQRRSYRIDTRLCREQVPCVVDAHYVNEPEAATPADIYAFLKSTSSTRLYLKPGRYRLRAWNDEGRTLSESVIDVPRS